MALILPVAGRSMQSHEKQRRAKIPTFFLAGFPAYPGSSQIFGHSDHL
jgi:hypothetical protein